MLLLTQTDQTIQQRLAEELADVEGRFAAELQSDLTCVNQLVAHVERYRGKMLRPMLVLASGFATADSDERLCEAHRVVATVVEMVHMATLVHDDILDEAQVRRRGVTINHLKGNEAAVMLGDYLISHAYHLCSSLDRPAINRVIAEATNTVCEGELLQLTNRENWQLDEKTYFEILRRKTASLCGTCCKLAGMLNESSLAQCEALFEYGEKLGIAFQIVDDLLDLIGREDTVGKTLGRDIRMGKLTLPLIHQLTIVGERHRQQLLDMLMTHVASVGANGKDIAGAMAIAKLLVDNGSVDYAQDWAGRLVEQAKGALDVLDNSPARDLLCDLANAVLARRH